MVTRKNELSDPKLNKTILLYRSKSTVCGFAAGLAKLCV